MAAVLQPTSTENTLVATSFTGAEHPINGRTEMPAPKPPNQPFAPIIPRRTEASKADPRNAFAVRSSLHVEHTPVLSPSTLSSVSAVIDEITTDSVVVQCLMAEGSLKLRLPPSLIPADLLTFGQPISISLRTQGGVRAPLIQRRQISTQEQFSDQPELDRWIETL